MSAVSRADMVVATMSSRLRSAGAAFRSGQLAPIYRPKPLLPGLPIQIEIHKERLKPRSDRYIRIRDKSQNELARSLICSHVKYWNSLCHSPTAYTPMSIFGKFSGPKFTQSGYACSHLKAPLLFVDKIVIHDTLEVVACPERIMAMLESPLGISCSLYRVLPWICDAIEIGRDDARLQIQSYVSEMSHTDSYMKDVFQIDGPGEGLIFFPELPSLSITQYNELGFTASATKSVDHFSSLAQRIGSELARKIQDFVQANLTVEILQKGMDNVALDKANTRLVMNNVIAMIRDKQKSLQMYGFPQAEMEHAVGRAAAEWFIDKCNKI